jgi:hypothetical protein
LPEDEPGLSRNLNLYFACSIGVFIFVLSNGYKALLTSILELFSNGIHLLKPTMISFIGVSFCIARIEYEKQII